MDPKDLTIQVWREKFNAEAQQCASAWVEAGIHRARADALQKELDELKKANAAEQEAVKPELRAVPD